MCSGLTFFFFHLVVGLATPTEVLQPHPDPYCSVQGSFLLHSHPLRLATPYSAIIGYTNAEHSSSPYSKTLPHPHHIRNFSPTHRRVSKPSQPPTRCVSARGRRSSLSPGHFIPTTRVWNKITWDTSGYTAELGRVGFVCLDVGGKLSAHPPGSVTSGTRMNPQRTTQHI